MSLVNFSDKTPRPVKPKDVNLLVSLASEMLRLRDENRARVNKIEHQHAEINRTLSLSRNRASNTAPGAGVSDNNQRPADSRRRLKLS